MCTVSQPIMKIGRDSLLRRRHLLLLLIAAAAVALRINPAAAVCEFSITDRHKLYNYSLASPTPKFPHFALSEDGFYKVASNGTVLWFQLCDAMTFNHDPPRCVDCRDCGGSAHRGMHCSALVSSNIGGYHVCSTLGRTSSTTTDLLDKNNPHMGVTVRMSHRGPKLNCSLSVSVICDQKLVQRPQRLERSGPCDYATQIRHPSGCANIVSAHGNGWGWFGSFIIIIFCLFGGYLLVGTGYRFFYLGIHGIDAIPNLELWARLPHRAQSLLMSLVRRFRGPSEGYRSSYSPDNF